MRQKRRDVHVLLALDNTTTCCPIDPLALPSSPPPLQVSVHSTRTLSAEIWQVFILCELQTRSADVFILRELRIRRRRGMNFVNARRAKRRKRDFFMRQKRRDYVDRRCRRDPSLRSVARDDDAGRIVSLGTRGGRGACLAPQCQPAIGSSAVFEGGDFVIGRKLLMVFVNAAKLILLVDVRGGIFARKNAHGGN